MDESLHRGTSTRSVPDDLDSPTPDGCGILSSTRIAFASKVLHPVPERLRPKPHVPGVTQYVSGEDVSRRFRQHRGGDGLVLATRRFLFLQSFTPGRTFSRQP